MKRRMGLLILSLLMVLGCAGFEPNTDIKVEVSRHRYTPLLEQSKFSDYQGKLMILDSIEVAETANVTNFHYLSENKTIGYSLFYSPSSMQQPIASFFWYAFQKTFESIGIIIKDSGPLKNVPELHLKILSLTDQQANFQVSLLRNGLLLSQKEINVIQTLTPTRDAAELV